MSDLKESFNDYKNFRKRIISNKKKSSTNILLDILSNNKDYTYKVDIRRFVHTISTMSYSSYSKEDKDEIAESCFNKTWKELVEIANR